MTCYRRSLFSTRAITGLVSGMLFGFLVGSLHFTVLNTQIQPIHDTNYMQGVLPPCDQTLNGYLLQDENNYWHLPSVNDNKQNKFKDSVYLMNSPERANPLSLERYEEVGEVNKEDAINGYDFALDDKETRMLKQKEIEHIYESNFEHVLENSNYDRVIPGDPKSLNDRHSDSSFHRFQIDTDNGDLADQRKGFLYVGVMTAAKYIPTRGLAITGTWAKTVPGKVEFYVGEGVTLQPDIEKEIDVIKLRKVDDNAYPPQKKSFMMLKYMYDHYINGYEWFMRADDDVYVKPDKLENLLRRLNSSEPIFIGQTGLGNEEEQGKLTLNHGENYCMGGPGMIFSREVLRRMVPHIGTCLRNMYTNHEDVEISRCVSRYANIHCVWSYEMKELFYEHYTQRKGYIDTSNSVIKNSLLKAITLHPNKQPDYQRKLHEFFLMEKIKSVQTKLRTMYRDVVEMDTQLKRNPDVEEVIIGIAPTLNRFRPTNGSQILSWEFLSDRLFLLPPESARRSIPSYTLVSIKEIVTQLVSMMNGNSKVRGRVINFKRVNYGYMRVNPLFGAEYVLDLLLNYNRYRGKQVSLPVRRHAYVQQTFARPEMKEDCAVDLAVLVRKAITGSRPGFLEAMARALVPDPVQAAFGFKKMSRSFYEVYGDLGANVETIYNFDNGHNDAEQSMLTLGNPGLNCGYATEDNFKPSPPAVNIIVPLTGRFLTFQRFVENLENVALKRNEPVSLLVMLFMPQDKEQRMEMRLTQQLVKDLTLRYPKHEVRILPIAGQFSRGLALEIGAAQFSEASLLFFCDVDVVFSSHFLRSCRSNTEQGKSVYYPILFSEFDPSNGHSPLTVEGHRKNHYKIDYNSGYWRSFGYGLLCVYQSDFIATGGFDTTIKGWGFEDVDLYSKFLKAPEEGAKKIVTAYPMRVKDPHLIHIYHKSHCDPELSEKQRTMCEASKNSGVASSSILYHKWHNDQSSKENGRVAGHDVAILGQKDALSNSKQQRNKYMNDNDSER